MKIEPSSHQSGKLGNVIISRNRGGYYQRSWVKPLNPRTLAQQATRSAFGAAPGAWRCLTLQQQDQWDSYAKLRDFPGGGRSAFISVFRIKTLMGEVPITTPPAPAAFQEFTATGLSAQLSAQGFRLALSGAADSTPNVRYKLEATRPSSPSRRKRDHELVILKCPATLADLGDAVALGQAYVDRFGRTPPGEAIILRVTQVLDGQYGVPFTGTAIITKAA